MRFVGTFLFCVFFLSFFLKKSSRTTQNKNNIQIRTKRIRRGYTQLVRCSCCIGLHRGDNRIKRQLGWYRYSVSSTSCHSSRQNLKIHAKSSNFNWHDSECTSCSRMDDHAYDICYICIWIDGNPIVQRKI